METISTISFFSDENSNLSKAMFAIRVAKSLIEDDGGFQSIEVLADGATNYLTAHLRPDDEKNLKNFF